MLLANWWRAKWRGLAEKLPPKKATGKDNGKNKVEEVPKKKHKFSATGK